VVGRNLGSRFGDEFTARIGHNPVAWLTRRPWYCPPRCWGFQSEFVRDMRARTLASACAGLVLAWSAASFAEPQLASPADGKAMLERAIAALKADEAAALKAFNDEKNKDFRDRDLYVYCFSLPEGKFTAYQSPVLLGTNIKELKIPPNDPVGQRAYDAVAKAADGEIVTFTYDFPKPGSKGSAPKETLETRVGKQACGVSYFKS
jgi:hypothetical protein